MLHGCRLRSSRFAAASRSARIIVAREHSRCSRSRRTPRSHRTREPFPWKPAIAEGFRFPLRCAASSRNPARDKRAAHASFIFSTMLATFAARLDSGLRSRVRQRGRDFRRTISVDIHPTRPASLARHRQRPLTSASVMPGRYGSRVKQFSTCWRKLMLPPVRRLADAAAKYSRI